ncbi:MAG: iron hydrogenase small subunit, partial [Kiritimatiellae bacterium]|nr:iron hydrogenase small subunit [Kiritimatiellia bacterium]
ADMLKEAGIALDTLKESEYDNPLGKSSGAGVIFGASGGVLEAALRTAADWLSGEDVQEIDFKAVRGLEGVKEATVNVAGLELKAAITSGLGNARKILEKIQRGEAEYHIIEIMACPGGCLNGGGQPYSAHDSTILEKRKEAIYTDDKNSTIRKSHQNPDIIKLYDEFLKEPGSHLAHELLHTAYTPRKFD